MNKRVIIVHGWDGYPEEGWFPWLKTELEAKGFEVTVPQMTDAANPRIQNWVPALTEVVGEPDKNLYFTEQWVGGPGDFRGDLSWHIENVIIGATRNWSRNALEWNLASDPSYKPHTTGGCTTCLGAITIGPAISRVHFSKVTTPLPPRLRRAPTGADQIRAP